MEAKMVEWGNFEKRGKMAHSHQSLIRTGKFEWGNFEWGNVLPTPLAPTPQSSSKAGFRFIFEEWGNPTPKGGIKTPPLMGRFVSPSIFRGRRFSRLVLAKSEEV